MARDADAGGVEVGWDMGAAGAGIGAAVGAVVGAETAGSSAIECITPER